ncbi:MAG: hypothetical protein CL583_03910 [Alteromonadaceae bacterium]|nr:hypothetical protein [Alteromonadaceae bacterium]|tara:strand:+ start:193 stop:1074 length:882 start_codon:yes stop_codon:yes gene_type:complete
MRTRILPLSAAIGISVLLTACASAPPENETVTEAREIYQSIENDPNVARTGATPLREAKNHLDRAQEMLEEGEEDRLVEHEAYLARGYAQIAETRGERNKIQQEIESAKNRRDELRLEMRSAEARQAQSRAQRAMSEAERAQNEAKLAQQEAEELRKQMQELKELQAQQTDRGMVLTLGDVLFDLNQAELQGTGITAVEKLAEFMKEYEDRRVKVEGYTDSTGSEAYNQQLSERRAQAVKDVLMNNGVASDRVEVQGYGEAYPVASNDDPSGRQRNRRVEIVISDEDGNIESR